MGRPTKIEGNPEHPASLGATDVFTQAAILGPLRSRSIAGDHASWRDPTVERASSTRCAPAPSQKAAGGAGLRILTETVTSPTLGAQIRGLLADTPGKWHQWEPAGRDNARAGAKLAFGGYVETRYDFDAGRRHPLARRRLLLDGARARSLRQGLESRRRRRERREDLRGSTSSRACRPTPAPRPIIACGQDAASSRRIALAVAAELGVAGTPSRRARSKRPEVRHRRRGRSEDAARQEPGRRRRMRRPPSTPWRTR